MATLGEKVFTDTSVGTIVVKKHKKSKNLRMRFNKVGQLQVTIPTWTPFLAGKQYALSNSQWVEKHRPQIVRFSDGAIIGRNEKLSIVYGETFSVRLVKSGVRATITTLDELDEETDALLKACYKSLKRQALVLCEESLNKHIHLLGNDFQNLRIARTHSRWGSCSSEGTVSFSIFVAQLPDRLIDYIVVHELAHTTEMNHSREFWQEVENILPDYKSRQKELKSYRLALQLNP